MCKHDRRGEQFCCETFKIQTDSYDSLVMKLFSMIDMIVSTEKKYLFIQRYKWRQANGHPQIKILI